MNLSDPSTDKILNTNNFTMDQMPQKFTDHQIKAMLNEMKQQIQLSKQKDRQIDEMNEQKKELQTQIQKAKQINSKIKQQIDSYDKKKYSQEEQQEEEKEEEQEMEMPNFQNLVQIQKKALQMMNGLPEEAIMLIPSFEFEEGISENQICFTCFEAFQIKALVKCLPCYHFFHQKCINESLKVTKFCPACQEEVQVS